MNPVPQPFTPDPTIRSIQTKTNKQKKNRSLVSHPNFSRLRLYFLVMQAHDSFTTRKTFMDGKSHNWSVYSLKCPTKYLTAVSFMRAPRGMILAAILPEATGNKSRALWSYRVLHWSRSWCCTANGRSWHQDFLPESCRTEGWKGFLTQRTFWQKASPVRR